ncbi:MAG: 2-C-methyl-D-erythritol 2,4-cyclodiphosphate synthase [Endomicrobiia bacterium]
MKKNNFRIGIGYDIHQLKKGRELILGGVSIPSTRGLYGHSDADVVLHAVADAILGAGGLKDIGFHFPNNDKKYKDISSKIILKEVFRMVSKKGFKVVNVDCTIIAEEPKIQPYRENIKKNISGILQTENINIKATTNEKLGLIGKGKGIACFAVALLEKNE